MKLPARQTYAAVNAPRMIFSLTDNEQSTTRNAELEAHVTSAASETKTLSIRISPPEFSR